jgi:hypothetical protein
VETIAAPVKENPDQSVTQVHTEALDRFGPTQAVAAARHALVKKDALELWFLVLLQLVLLQF